MNDYIDRQAAIDALARTAREKFNLSDEFNHYLAGLLDGEVAIRQLPSAQPKQQWIPVNEMLPKQGQEVICQCRASIITVLKLDANGDWYQDARHCYMRGFVIAWMPLPEPYKGEDHEQN